ncbi:hypothetical protein CALVIDRAFT_364614 [Calocera viscosa TUFC12733]|uniref:Bulb-type lectin domain-containing protein n=1 Tax=Calocera viscosa (strain TUFC12733) TaxID=1330018 RepID=A0A167H5J7_CALVF|nr:hypothetical protein CALVIDRAFT_364614 [Calocera viscosa TUFC12733]
MQRLRQRLRSDSPASSSSPKQAPSTAGPPPVPFHTRPGAPARPPSGASPAAPPAAHLAAPPAVPTVAASSPVVQHSGSSGISEPYPAGAIYAPGQWPTPELSIYPLGTWRLLSDPDYGWTSQSIQAALDAIGEGGTIYLPRSSKWDIAETIKMHPWQELATEGYPTTEGDMASLDATKDLRPFIVNAWDTSGVRLRNLIVDGKHDLYGREDQCGCLIQFGGSNPATKDQWCDRCIIRNPRQWSCFQAFEGANNVRITNCRVGPAGLGKDVREGHWADGISFAAGNGLVAGNEIIDATDGAIVVFQATGTLVTSNTIVCYSRLLLGGINMVDHAPGKGDYAQTRVVHNTILTAGGYIITGIAQGPTAWGAGPGEPKEDTVNRNAIVARNLIHYQDRGRGRGAIGYGFAISADVENWTCMDNVSADGVVYEGDMNDGDWQPTGLSVAPGPFVRSAGPVEKLGKLQKEFVPGLLRGLLVIKPGRSSVLRLFPGQLQLRPGDSIPLKKWMLEFCRDGEVIFRNAESGTIRWSAGSRGRISGHEDTALLELAVSGHLRIVESTKPDQVLFNLSSVLPPGGIPGCTPASTSLPSLHISDNEPHLQLVGPDNGILLSSSYEVGMNRLFPTGAYICRPSLNNEATIVSVMSPYGQYMVLSTRNGMQMNFPLGSVGWPLDVSKWYVIWETPNEPLKEKADCTLAFQGDGNLVIYANGNALWNTMTYGPPDKAARFLRWGDGSPQQPYLELLTETRQRAWST